MSLIEKSYKVKNTNVGTTEVLLRFNQSVAYVIKRWWIFALAGLCGGIFGIIYHYNKKTEYKSQLIFVLEDGEGNSNSLSLMNLATQFGFSGSTGENIFSSENIFEVIKSRRIIESALLSVDTFGNKPYTFMEYYLEFSGIRKSNPSIKNIHFPVDQVRSNFSYQQDSLLKEIYQQFSQKYVLATQPRIPLNLYQVSVISIDENFTKKFTDEVIEKTSNYYLEIKTAKSKELLNSLEDRVTSLEGSLNSSFSRAATLKDLNLHPAFSSGLVPIQKQQVNIEVFGQSHSEVFKYLELARLQYLNNKPLMEIVDGAEYPMQKIQFGKWYNFFLFSIFSILLVMCVMSFYHLLKPKITTINN